MNYTFKRHLVLNFQEVSSASVIADTKYHKKKGGSDNNKNNQASGIRNKTSKSSSNLNDGANFKYVWLYIYNSKNELHKVVPFGKDAFITYDKFYDSYHIMFTFQDGTTGHDLRYVKTDVNGIKIYYDKLGNENKRFYVNNDEFLSKDKAFILLMMDKMEENGKLYTIGFRFINTP